MQPSRDPALARELAKAREENQRLKRNQLKVSQSGGVSLYGLGRYPVTLYKNQWRRLLELAEDIRGFIRDNESRLKTKPRGEE